MEGGDERCATGPEILSAMDWSVDAGEGLWWCVPAAMLGAQLGHLERRPAAVPAVALVGATNAELPADVDSGRCADRGLRRPGWKPLWAC